MLSIQPVQRDNQLYLDIPGFEISPEQLARQSPDQMLIGKETGPAAAARCGLWTSSAPHLPGERVGVVGHYYAATSDAGVAMLSAAAHHLAQAGCTIAVGPMDGNTWQRYRLVTDRGSQPPFFLEPDNPDDWPDHFRATGFVPLAHYYSALTTHMRERDPRGPAIAERLSQRGIRVRPATLNSFDEELRRIHALSLVSFAGNFLYTPISLDEFLALYAPIRPFLRPDLILIAERGSELVGFLFAVPDLLQKYRGQPIDTVIVKTLAVHPDHAGLGLGTYLMDRVHAAIHEAGYRQAIHALFHESNFSGKISRHTAHVIRRYTLFSRPLAGLP